MSFARTQHLLFAQATLLQARPRDIRFLVRDWGCVEFAYIPTHPPGLNFKFVCWAMGTMTWVGIHPNTQLLSVTQSGDRSIFVLLLITGGHGDLS